MFYGDLLNHISAKLYHFSREMGLCKVIVNYEVFI